MSDASSSNYRSDIDGLRAIAVAVVLAYHGFREWLPQGFIGVDVFFVISGFLISGIIFDQLDRGTFSFTEFYSRRIRRIVPALSIVCAVSLVFGWICLLPDEFQQLGRHVFGAATFSSNLVLLAEADYFDLEAWRKPLLHLWSLGIEEQYYVVWPLLLIAFRGRPRATRRLIAVTGILSFGLSLLLTSRAASAAFYLPFTRFWELMIGSALSHWQRYGTLSTDPVVGAVGRFSTPVRSRIAAQTCGVAGLGALGVALFDVDLGRPFPGWWALLVCGGAAMLIAAGPAAWTNRLLSTRPLVAIGLISYPLYLWHLPLLSFARLIGGEGDGALSVTVRLGLCAIAVLLAWGTRAIVEVPIRRTASTRQLRLAATLVAGLAVVAGAGTLALHAEVRPLARAADSGFKSFYQARSDFEHVTSRTVQGQRGTVLLFGDSHMEQYWPRLEKLLSDHTDRLKSIELRVKPSCAPIPGIERETVDCLDFVRGMFARAAQPDVDTVVIAGSWVGFAARSDYYRAGAARRAHLDMLAPTSQWVFDGFTETLRSQRQQRKRVIVLLSSPRGAALAPWALVDRHWIVPQLRRFVPMRREAMNALLAPIDSRIAAAAWSAGAEVMNPSDWFCSATECPAAEFAGEPLLMDGSHLRASIVRNRAWELDQLVISN